MTDEYVGTDGHRCLTGNPLLDTTWRQVFKAEISYGGQVYSTTVVYGGLDAENYGCCWDQTCFPWEPCED